jgi:hypothetical protein
MAGAGTKADDLMSWYREMKHGPVDQRNTAGAVRDADREAPSRKKVRSLGFTIPAV